MIIRDFNLRRPVPLLEDDGEAVGPSEIAVVLIYGKAYVMAYYDVHRPSRIAAWHDDGRVEPGQKVVTPSFIPPNSELNDKIYDYLSMFGPGVLQTAMQAASMAVSRASDAEEADSHEVLCALAMATLAHLRGAVVH